MFGGPEGRHPKNTEIDLVSGKTRVLFTIGIFRNSPNFNNVCNGRFIWEKREMVSFKELLKYIGVIIVVIFVLGPFVAWVP